MPQPIYINLAPGSRTADVTLRGFVGRWGSDLESIEERLAGLDVDLIRLRINTLGGLVHEGIAIHNVLRAHAARVEVIVEGIAGSAGSVVAMAGDEIVMYANAVMMIHGVRAVDSWGDEVDTPETRAAVAAFNAAMIETYRARTGKSEDELADMLATETWMTAREAVAAGFADRVEELHGEPAAAVEASGALALIASAADIPAEVLARAQAEAAAPDPETSEGGDPPADAPEGESDDPAAPPADGDDPDADDADDVGGPAGDAPTFAARVNELAVAHGLGEFVAAWLLDGDIENEDQARAAIAEAREVHDLCAYAGSADLAAGFIRDRRPLAAVRAELINRLAVDDELNHTDGHARTQHGPTITGKAVWAKVLPNRQTKE